MKKYSVILIFLTLFACKNTAISDASSSIKVNTVLDNWHKAAANADYKTYFDLMSDDAVFIGTDATENWNKKDFQAYAKPHFDKGKAWSFTTLERNLFFEKTGNIAWFDELLETQMKICRGSGVLVKIKNEWKIKHYVLSMTIPNENSNQVIKIKTSEDFIIEKLKLKQ
ncbi:ketosteroid isomerase-like protein [Flavobacterium sp. PL11]|jgi:ketosteroid isomerase-like protein|uniref:nuclear transport factor 2 family protein n=1 Tax=Flavobacterium sp. PL11 TaxID=3071717 RepID=UPI002E0C6B41|nr:ketosteroid isomerase-like protein [Flavobacterium sp. PL11]